MIIIDDPYVSRPVLDYLKYSDTRAALLNIPAAGVGDFNADEFLKPAEAARIIENNPDLKLLCLSENSLQWLQNYHPDRTLIKLIRLFKDKYRTRQLLRDFDPEFYFKTASLQQLIEDKSIKPDKYPVIIKPRSGFFSIGVERINNDMEWEKYRRKLSVECRTGNELFPESVLSSREFLIEELINGTEIACDAFFSENGRPVILGIYQHDFASDTDMSDRLYRISAQIIEKYYHIVMKFLAFIAAETALKKFPLHIELRISDDGNAHLIEINPLRFGGWCTTADVNEFAFNMNSYHHFFHDIIVTKKELLTAIGARELALIILDKRGKCLNVRENAVDLNKLAAGFKTLHQIRPVDAARFPLFGFIIAELSAQDDISREEILISDLSNYCRK